MKKHLFFITCFLIFIIGSSESKNVNLITEYSNFIDNKNDISESMNFIEKINNINFKQNKFINRANQAPSNLILKLDSIIESGNIKLMFSYDNRGLLVQETMLIKNNKGEWINYRKVETKYNNSKNLELRHNYEWDKNASSWGEPVKSFEYAFDSNNRVIEEKISYFDSKKVNTKTTFTNNNNNNNNNGLISEAYFYNWDSNTNSWLNETLVSLYFTNNILTEIISSVWENNSWLNSSRITNTTSPNNKTGMSIFSDWNKLENKWEDSNKFTYEYDGKNNVISEIFESFDEDENEWLKLSRYLYEYNDFGLKTKMDIQYWESTEWETSYVNNWEYDSNNNMTKMTSEMDLGIGDFTMIIEQQIYTYDTSYLLNEILFPIQISEDGDFFVTNEFTSQLLGELEIAEMLEVNFENKINRIDYGYNFGFGDDDDIEMDSFANFYYSDAIFSSVDIFNEYDVNIYPNPASDLLHINVDNTSQTEFILLDLKGALVISSSFTGNKTININQLQKGIYIYSIKNDTQNKHGKLIIH